MPPNSGVLYVAWGDVEGLLQRSISSLRAVHPDMPVHIQRLPANATLLEKACLFEWTPFEHTLFLDLDTVVLKPLDFGFAKAAEHALACCINENPWARRYPGFEGDSIEYNTGVLFFSRRAEPVLRAWKHCASRVDASSQFHAGNQVLPALPNDQASFARAIEETKFVPFVLPLNWNFRPRFHKTFFGPVKIWHDFEPPAPAFLRWNNDAAQDGRVLRMGVLS